MLAVTGDRDIDDLACHRRPFLLRRLDDAVDRSRFRTGRGKILETEIAAQTGNTGQRPDALPAGLLDQGKDPLNKRVIDLRWHHDEQRSAIRR